MLAGLRRASLVNGREDRTSAPLWFVISSRLTTAGSRHIDNPRTRTALLRLQRVEHQ